MVPKAKHVTCENICQFHMFFALLTISLDKESNSHHVQIGLLYLLWEARSKSIRSYRDSKSSKSLGVAGLLSLSA